MPKPVSAEKQMDLGRERTLWARYQAFRSVPAEPIHTWEGHKSVFDRVEFATFTAVYKEILGLGGLAAWDQDEKLEEPATERSQSLKDRQIIRSFRSVMPESTTERTEEVEHRLILGLPRRTFEMAYVSHQRRLEDAMDAQVDGGTGSNVSYISPRTEELPASSGLETVARASAS